MQAYISTQVRLAMLPSGTRLSFRAASGEELGTTLALGRPVSLCTLTDQAVVDAVQQQCGVRVPLAASPALITLWPGDVLFLLQVDFQGRVQISLVVAQATTEPQPQRVTAIPDELPAVWVGEYSAPC